MVIGNGLLASAFIEDYSNVEDIIIFASGVSNSTEIHSDKYLKEKTLLLKTISMYSNAHFVYFSTSNELNLKNKDYFNHKIEMETILIKKTKSCTILRLPQVVGNGGNKNTLFNFFVEKIKNNETISVFENTYRSLIDIDDVKKIVDYILFSISNNNKIFEVTYIEKYLVIDIINYIGEKLSIIPKVNFIKSDLVNLRELNLEMINILNDLNINGDGYTKKIIDKYIN